MFWPTIISDTLHKSRNSASEVWGMVETDLNSAIGLLPLRSLIAEPKFHIQKGAAQALIVKAKIYQKKWAEALTFAEDIINSGEYALEPNFANCFSVDTKYGAESIFEIVRPPINGIDYFRSIYWISGNQNVYCNPRKMCLRLKTQDINMVDGRVQGYANYYGWGFNCPTEKYVNSFTPGDPRLKLTIASQNDSIAGILTRL